MTSGMKFGYWLSFLRYVDTILTITWQNFMKSLMKMYSEEDKGVVFYETVITLKWQKHSVIECVPVPWEQFDVLPGYFKVRILGKVYPPNFSQ